MKPPKRILCVIDPTEDDQPAMARAAMLAKAFDAKLRLYISYYYAYLTDIADDYGPVGGSFSDATIQAFQNRLEDMAEQLRSDGHSVSAKAEWKKDLPRSIIEEADRWGANLVVKDTHYHTAISRALFTNTDWILIRRCPVPLWLVKPTVDFSARPGVIACVDPVREHDKPESLDHDILSAASMLATELNGDLYAFHAFNPLVPVGKAATWAIGPEELPIDKLSGRMRDDHAAAFGELVEQYGVADKRRLLRDGTTQATLPPAALDLGTSLVVLGAVKRPQLREAVIGSTAESVMDHVPCDLLILKPS